ncbi:hypothetical protein ACE103_25435 [Bradyrhizobium sp. ma5]|uniref:COG3904 family protein n=1 Tax=Bradyrhizobium sp. ma5 TaxID=3344828 RepID=UPI0035D40DD6
MARIVEAAKAGLSAAMLLMSTGCLAMDIVRVPDCTGDVLKLSGDIGPGDFVRFRGFVGTERRVRGVDLDSGGGSLDEGFQIAMLAYRRQLTTYVSGECDSACAFIFLTSRKRYVSPGARIGVHSVSNEHGNEDNETIRDTIKLARLMAKHGISPSTIGKMVTTPPGKMSYLNKDDLAALKVIVRNPFDRIIRTSTAQAIKGSSRCDKGASDTVSKEGSPSLAGSGGKKS